jgi:hypothetical protein
MAITFTLRHGRWCTVSTLLVLRNPRLKHTKRLKWSSTHASGCGLLQEPTMPALGGVSSEPHPQALMYRAVASLPGTIQAPGSELVEHRLLWRDSEGAYSSRRRAILRRAEVYGPRKLVMPQHPRTRSTEKGNRHTALRTRGILCGEPGPDFRRDSWIGRSP